MKFSRMLILGLIFLLTLVEISGAQLGVDLIFKTQSNPQDTVLYIRAIVATDSLLTQIVDSISWTKCLPDSQFTWHITLPQVEKEYFWGGWHKNTLGGSISNLSEVFHFFVAQRLKLGAPDPSLPANGWTIWYVLAEGSFTVKEGYPNPFESSINIEYNLDQGSPVQVIIYNNLGQKVKTVLDEYQEPGTKKLTWDGTNDSGQKVASGIYFFKVRTTSNEGTNKAILVK